MHNRPLSKVAYSEEFVGDTKRSTAAYKKVREDASIGSTHKLPLEVEFGKRSDDYTALYVIKRLIKDHVKPYANKIYFAIFCMA
ncbi:MAG: palindromic element RPE1 domain-containing protein, partial [Rickettsia sp.]